MTRVFCGFCLGLMLVWGTACGSDDDKKKTTTNKLCTENTECSEPFFECEHVTTTTTGTCTKPCTDSSQCPSNYQCLSNDGVGLEPSCMALCSGGCPSGHTCGGETTDGVGFCIPQAWTGSG
jgi:hypothetical protein